MWRKNMINDIATAIAWLAISALLLSGMAL